MKPLPDVDENYSYMQNMRYVFEVLECYLIFLPFMLVDYFKLKGRCK